MLLVSCSSPYQKLVKSEDYNKKYTEGIRYFEEKQYGKSITLLESIVSVYKGTGRDESINFTLAQSYYSVNDFRMAGYYFKRFVSTFPISDKADDSYFYMSMCYYYLSAPYKLDQEYTDKAIRSFKIFLEKYPESDKIASCTKYMTELHKKKSKKAFYNAELYYKIGDYRAAVIALKSYLDDYPDSDYREESLFLIVKSSYLLAENSVFSKQYQRYEAMIDEYYDYIDEYPQGKDSKEAERYFNNALKKVKGES